jgi:hypothetical protein
VDTDTNCLTADILRTSTDVDVQRHQPILNPPCGGSGGQSTFCTSFSLLVHNSTKRAVSPYQQPQEHIRKAHIWSPKQRRAYHRIISGYKYAHYLGGQLRFMTLTTSNEGADHVMKDDFNALVKRIRRHYGCFEYVCVRTSEGNGVLHILFRGGYIPRTWLKRQWEELHRSWNVDIRSTKRHHLSYVINQYMCGQDYFERYSVSMRWVHRGFVKIWKGFCRWYYKERLELWDDYLYNYAVSEMQKTLEDFG